MRRISAFALALALLLSGCAELSAPMLPQTLAPAAADAVTLAAEMESTGFFSEEV